MCVCVYVCVENLAAERRETQIVTHLLYHPPTLLDGGGVVKALPVGYSCSAQFQTRLSGSHTPMKTHRQWTSKRWPGLTKLLQPVVVGSLRRRTIPDVWGSGIRERRIGRVGVVQGLKKLREAEERTESERAQGPLVKHKGWRGKRNSEVRV